MAVFTRLRSRRPGAGRTSSGSRSSNATKCWRARSCIASTRCWTAGRSSSPASARCSRRPARAGGARRGGGGEVVDRVLERAAAAGADLALLFSEIGPDYYARLGFDTVPTTDLRLRVTESTRYGAPMTMVRGGDDRDLKDIVTM